MSITPLKRKLSESDLNSSNRIKRAPAPPKVPNADVMLLLSLEVTKQGSPDLKSKQVTKQPASSSDKTSVIQSAILPASNQTKPASSLPFDSSKSHTPACPNLVQGHVVPNPAPLGIGTAQMTQQQLLLKAIQLEPNLAWLFSALAITLQPGQSIDVNGTTMNQQQFYVKAIQLEPNLTQAYIGLAITVQPGQSIDVNGTPMNQQQFYLKAIQLEPNLAQAYIGLAITLQPGQSIDVNGTTMNQQQLLQKAQQSFAAPVPKKATAPRHVSMSAPGPTSSTTSQLRFL